MNGKNCSKNHICGWRQRSENVHGSWTDSWSDSWNDSEMGWDEESRRLAVPEIDEEESGQGKTDGD